MDLYCNLKRIAAFINAANRKPKDLGTGELLLSSEAHLIYFVGSYPGRTTTELSAIMDITKGAVSQLSGKLEKRGYITKTKAAGNDKTMFLSLTERGKKAFSVQRFLEDQINSRIVENIPDTVTNDIDLINDFLNGVEKSLKKML